MSSIINLVISFFVGLVLYIQPVNKETVDIEEPLNSTEIFQKLENYQKILDSWRFKASHVEAFFFISSENSSATKYRI